MADDGGGVARGDRSAGAPCAGGSPVLDGTSSPDPVRPCALVLGVPIDDLTMADALDAIGDLVADGRRTGRRHQIATVNVDFLVNALAEPDDRRLLQDTAINVADGLPVVWAARMTGNPVRERLAGADLVPSIAAAAARRGWRVHFFGSSPDVAERALTLLRERHPDAELSGASGPILRDVTDVEQSVIDEIASHAPDILCVALGNPKQERFIAANIDRLPVPVMIGIGGSLDMLVGDKKRAPQWAQRWGAEWVFRALQEPRRLGARYAKDAAIFGPRLIRWLRELRRHRNGPGLQVQLAEGPSGQACGAAVTVVAGGPSRLDASLRRRVGERIREGERVAVSFAGGVPDPAALGELIGLMRLARVSGVEATVTDLDAPTRDSLFALDVPHWVTDGFGSTRP